MSTIGIITINDNYNFGNRLQNFALQETLESLGHTAYTIRNTPRLGDGGGPLKKRVDLIRAKGLKPYTSKLRKERPSFAQQSPKRRKVLARVKEIEEFNEKHITVWSQGYNELQDPRQLARSFDRFVVGSDQVWNPRYRLLNEIDFLAFADPGQRVAYAASIGLDGLTRQQQRFYRRFLKDFPHISVREDSAAETVRDLTGRTVPVVLDPTLLLTELQWDKLATTPDEFVHGGYVLQFFLGEIGQGLRDTAQEYASSRNLELLDGNSALEMDYYLTSPTDFLGAIRNAEVVLTDSYHAAVFATLFSTPFLTQPRGGMNSRLVTLAGKTGVVSPIGRHLADFDAAIDVDWKSVRASLVLERAHSLAYLQRSLQTVETHGGCGGWAHDEGVS